ncbi:MAG: rhomboid family intramembrane serine protease [Thermodesulfobacteriota bacterium]|nr:rhomboid family intramembrane serine protease [Thermodesulfobacteriota bacterium]
MIPLRDSIPRVHTPYVVWGLIALNTFIFLLTAYLPPQALPIVFRLFGVVPARFSNPEWAAFVGFPQGGAYTFLTYMFLHGDWLHLLLNMWMLWIFADNIEDVMGPVRFLVFYVLCGLAALGVHYAFNMNSPLPVVGASGAIAGVMGAYFLLYPHARVVTLIPIIIIPYIVELPAVLFLGIWFLMQFFSGVSSSLSQGAASIAWWAHAGGFVAGMLLIPVFRVKERCYYCRDRYRD